MHVVRNAQRALTTRVATYDIAIVLVEVERLVAGSRVTTLAVVCPIEANIQGDIAAESTLIVNVFFAMAWL